MVDAANVEIAIGGLTHGFLLTGAAELLPLGL
jgi:hypothetical protein